MHSKIAQSCLTAFKNFHEMIIDILMQDELHDILYCNGFFALLSENIGYYELIEKPLQTLIKRIEESSVLVGYSGKGHYAEHSNGYSNFPDFLRSAEQSKIREFANSFRRLSVENGHANGYYDSPPAHVNGNRNETLNANALSMDGNERSLIEAQYQFDHDYAQSFSNCVPNNGQFVGLHTSNIPQEIHGTDIHLRDIDCLPATDSYKNTNDTMALPSNPSKQANYTIQTRCHNVDTENNHKHPNTDHVLCTSNYNLVMEAIVQLENDNKIDQQQVNKVQSTDISTTIDSQIHTLAREYLEPSPTHQTISTGTGTENSQMDTSAKNQKELQSNGTLNVPVACEDLVGNQRDLTKRPDDKEPTIVRSTRSNTKRLHEGIPIGQPKVILTDLIHTVGKDKLAGYRMAANKKPPASHKVRGKKTRKHIKQIDASDPKWSGFWKKKFPYGVQQG